MIKVFGNIQIARQKLLEAINDYPKENLISSTELLAELNKSIASPITLRKLQSYLNKIYLSTNAWEAESIASLLEVFYGFENKSLEQIIELINQNNS